MRLFSRGLDTGERLGAMSKQSGAPQCVGGRHPVEDGPFTAYMPPASNSLIRAWRAELIVLIDRCAHDMETDEERIEQFIAAALRQPDYTVWLDLVHYREWAALIEAREASGGNR